MSTNPNENSILVRIVQNLQLSAPKSWIGQTVCTGNTTLWIGLTCNNEGNITMVSLPSSFSSPTSMQAFDDFSKLPSLGYIDLSGNGLTGTLSPHWSSLNSLFFLNILVNSLEGSLPGMFDVCLKGLVLLAYRLLHTNFFFIPR